MKSKKGFTIIELIVVIAVIGILVLLSSPRFLGQTKEAKLTQIKNDTRVVEGQMDIYRIKFDDKLPEGVTLYNKDELKANIDEGKVYSIKGLHIDKDNLGGDFYKIPEDLVKRDARSKLKGEFIISKNTGGVFYIDTKSGKPIDSGEGNPVDGEEYDNELLDVDYDNTNKRFIMKFKNEVDDSKVKVSIGSLMNKPLTDDSKSINSSNTKEVFIPYSEGFKNEDETNGVAVFYWVDDKDTVREKIYYAVIGEYGKVTHFEEFENKSAEVFYNEGTIKVKVNGTLTEDEWMNFSIWLEGGGNDYFYNVTHLIGMTNNREFTFDITEPDFFGRILPEGDYHATVSIDGDVIEEGGKPYWLFDGYMQPFIDTKPTSATMEYLEAEHKLRITFEGGNIEDYLNELSVEYSEQIDSETINSLGSKNIHLVSHNVVEVNLERIPSNGQYYITSRISSLRYLDEIPVMITSIPEIEEGEFSEINSFETGNNEFFEVHVDANGEINEVAYYLEDGTKTLVIIDWEDSEFGYFEVNRTIGDKITKLEITTDNAIVEKNIERIVEMEWISFGDYTTFTLAMDDSIYSPSDIANVEYEIASDPKQIANVTWNGNEFTFTANRELEKNERIRVRLFDSLGNEIGSRSHKRTN